MKHPGTDYLSSLELVMNNHFTSTISAKGFSNRRYISWGYRIAGNFGGKNIWRIALIMAFGGFYFGGWVYHNYIHSKMVTYVTDRNCSSVNTAESVSNHSTSNEAGTS